MIAAASAYHAYLRGKSATMYALCIASAAAILLVLGLIVGYLAAAGGRELTPAFFLHDPIDNGGAYGMRAGIVGTMMLIAVASCVGVPIGTCAGIYLAEYGSNSRLADATRFVADVLAGVPSIVVGILGFCLLARSHYNGWAGALALSFIMIPLVTRTTEEMLRLVPRSYREASAALGASKSRTIFRVVLPAAASGLITGIMLAVARVAGETAPLLFTALNYDHLTFNLSRQFPSLTVKIFDDAMVVDPRRNAAARAGILVLLLLVFALNLIVRFAAGTGLRRRQRASR